MSACWRPALLKSRSISSMPTRKPPLTEGDHARLRTLGRDLAQAWESPSATAETRKKIIRTVISEIIVEVVGDGLALVIPWQGGNHTRLTVKRNRPGQTRWATDDDIVDLVRALARQMPDQTIAALLNRSGKSTGYGNSWTRSRICSLRHQYQIAVYREGERADRGEATLHEAATALALSTTTIRRLIAAYCLQANIAKAPPGSFGWPIWSGTMYAGDTGRGCAQNGVDPIEAADRIAALAGLALVAARSLGIVEIGAVCAGAGCPHRRHVADLRGGARHDRARQHRIAGSYHAMLG